MQGVGLHTIRFAGSLPFINATSGFLPEKLLKSLVNVELGICFCLVWYREGVVTIFINVYYNLSTEAKIPRNTPWGTWTWIAIHSP